MRARLEEMDQAVIASIVGWASISESAICSKYLKNWYNQVLTMELVAEYQGIDTDQAIWQDFRHHWLA